MAVVLRSSELQGQLRAVDVGVQVSDGAQHDHLNQKSITYINWSILMIF